MKETMTCTDIRTIEETFKNYTPVGEHGFKHFAVLLPLMEEAGRTEVLYEVRAERLIRQPGEICFPGGLIEKGETPLECALRETEEEIGVKADSIRIISKLDSVFSAGGSQIHCFLGVIEHGDIDFLHIAVGEVGQPIEKVGVLSLEMNGYDISLIFNALGDKGLFPLHIFNLLSSAS